MNDTGRRQGSAAASGNDVAPADGPGRMAELAVVLVGALVVLSTAVIAPALPAIGAYFSEDPRTETLVPMLVTMPALVIGIAAPFAGYVLDRFGRYAAVLTALVSFIIFGVAGAFASSLDMLLWSRAGLGLCVAFLMAGFTSLVGDLFAPKARAAVLGRQASLNAIMALIMTMLGGILTEWDWRGMFLVYLIAVPLVFLFVRHVPRKPARRPSRQGDDRIAPASGGNWLLVAAIYLLAVLAMVFSMLVPTRTPFLMQAQYGGTAFIIAFAMSVFTFGMFPTAALFARLRRIFSAPMLFTFGFAALGAGFALQGVASNLTLLIVGMGISGAGFGCIMPNLNTSLLAAAPAHLRGRLAGGLVSAIFMGQFFSPIVSQPLVQRYDIQTSFVVSAILAGIVAIACLLPTLRRKRRRA